MRLCSAVTFAVVFPVTPAAMRRASTIATFRPACLSSQAAVMPAMPPPSTATSTCTPAGSGGNAVGGVEAIQSDSGRPGSEDGDVTRGPPVS